MRVMHAGPELLQLLLRAFPPDDPDTCTKLESIIAAVDEGRSIVIRVQESDVYISPTPETPPLFLISDQTGKVQRQPLGG